MKIGTNMPALNTWISMKQTDRLLSSALHKLSSSKRINSVKDDPAGLAIANKLSSQILGLHRSSQNALDGISLIQTADGAMNGLHALLQRMRELAVQAANGVLLPEDRDKIQKEVDSLTDEITDNSKKAEFNRIQLLNGEADWIRESLRDNGGVLEIGDGFATALYMSNSVQPGRLTYTIDSVGLPAVMQIDDISVLAGQKFTINEVEVDLFGAAPTDLDVIRERLLHACYLADIDLQFDGTGSLAYLATYKAGSTQEINITADNIVSGGAPFGGKATGTDAVISFPPYDPLTYTPGDPVPFMNPNGTPNISMINSMSVIAKGNEVTITSTGGQIIRLNVRIINMADQGFVYANGTAKDPVTGLPIVPPFSNGTDVSAGPIDMILEIKDFGPLFYQIGPNYNQHMPVQIPKVTAETLGFVEYKANGVNRLLNYKSTVGATEAITIVDRAISEVSEVRARLGAYQNRLEQTVRNLDAAAENMERSRSRFEDTDIGLMMTEYTTQNVKYQAGMAIMSQANMRPQQILQLLR